MAVLEHLVPIMKEMKAKVNTKQEKLVAKMKASQEETEAIAEQYKWAPCIKATYLLTTLQGCTSDYLHGDLNGTTYGLVWDQHLVTLCCTELKTRIQIIADIL
jgi:hypothetical protein